MFVIPGCSSQSYECERISLSREVAFETINGYRSRFLSSWIVTLILFDFSVPCGCHCPYHNWD
jgi:hypothetical protein